MNENIEVEKIVTKSGYDTLKVNGYFVHSSYNPIREAEQLAEKLYIPHYAHIIFGYGCGYLVEALRKKIQFDEVIIVVDPLFDTKIISRMPEHSELPIYTSEAIENLEFYISELASESRTSFQSICLSNYDKLFPELYKRFLMKVKDVQYRNRVNDHTLIRYAKDWQVNFTKNLYHLSNDVSLEKLYQVYNCPVVIASGGPSLSKQLERLKKIRRSVIVIAAGSTVNSLLAVGIEPDYIVTIDGGPPNYDHFKHLRLENSRIIYTMQNHPGVREVFLKKGYVIDTKGLDGFTRYLKDRVKVNLPLLTGGGTVAHVTFTIAQYISSGPIALIGQDLAYTDNLTHAANNIHARQIDEAFIKEWEAFQTESYYGDLVWTNPIFYSMKLEFEEMIKMEYPEVPFFNCTEGGIKLNGFDQLPFSAFIEQYVKPFSVEVIDPSEEDVQHFDVNVLLEQDIKSYKKLLGYLTEGLNAVSKNRSNTHFDVDVLKKLERVDKKSKVLLSQLPVDSIVSPITLEVIRGYLPKLNETEQEAYTRVSNQTKTLYKKLIEAIQFSKNCTEEVLTQHRQSEVIK